METIPIARFKATCLAVLEEVRRTGRPVLVTRRGQPVAEVVPASHQGPASRLLGEASGRGRIVADIVAPVTSSSDWETIAGPDAEP